MVTKKTEADHAAERITDEVTTGGIMELGDGTVIEDGVVKKRGPRAIFNDKDQLVGYKHD